MPRSLLVPLSSFALVALLLAPGSANAQSFTEADLEGDYGLHLTPDGAWGFFGGGHSLLGRLTLDGRGGVVGSRTLSRVVQETRTSASTLRVVLEQDLVGTYSIEADGTGVMTLEVSPNPNWEHAALGTTIEFDGPETLRFVLTDGGAQLRLNLEVSGRLFRTHDGLDLGRTHHNLSGTAERQSPAADPRIDALQAQLCEVLRLLNTPQGQRETSTPDVVEACGTGYEWNGEGTGGPRRGR